MLKLSPRVIKTCALPLAVAEELRAVAQELGVTELSIIVAGLRAELARIKQVKGDE